MGQAKSAVKRYGMNYNVVNRAEKVVTKIETGERQVAAPRYEVDKEQTLTPEQEQIIDKNIKEKFPNLVLRVEQMKIKSIDPPEPAKSERALPSRTSEMKYGMIETEYGFYEPPFEDIPNGRLTFREALQLMSAKAALERDPSDCVAADLLRTHMAAKRISSNQLDNMLKYFSPFESIEGAVLLKPEHIQALLLAAKPGNELDPRMQPVDASKGASRTMHDLQEYYRTAINRMTGRNNKIQSEPKPQLLPEQNKPSSTNDKNR